METVFENYMHKGTGEFWKAYSKSMGYEDIAYVFPDYSEYQIVGTDEPKFQRLLKIEIDHSCFEDQSSRLITEFGLPKKEAEIISKAVKDLIDAKIDEHRKNWSKSVRESFINLMTAILIEEVKAIAPPFDIQKPTPITQIADLTAYSRSKTVRYSPTCV